MLCAGDVAGFIGGQEQYEVRDFFRLGDAAEGNLQQRFAAAFIGRLEGMSGRYDKASFGPLVEGAKAIYKSGSLTITPVSMIAEAPRDGGADRLLL